jgi:hypothetical protein
MGGGQLGRALARLQDGGVTIVDPRQTYVAPDVDLDRVCKGAILHAGSRICGARTFVGPGAEVGVQGPATLVDAVLDAGAKVDAGYVEGAVLLAGARLGWGAHVRPGTLLEEQASTAHCVGLKHTIVLAFGTLGSVVNFCDILLAGGTSRRDHSEVGSGFIHFNFSPWGAHGDKATASLVGDVVRGVFLRERRIFLGGAGGMVGPRSIGYGSVTAAGQVVRRDVDAERLVLQAPREIDREHPAGSLDPAARRGSANVQYIAQLVALRAWYRAVRSGRLPAGDDFAPARAVVAAALQTLDVCVAERVDRLRAFLAERGEAMPALDLDPQVACPLKVDPAEPHVEHLDWVRALGDDEVAAGQAWLQEIAQAVVGSAGGRA